MKDRYGGKKKPQSFGAYPALGIAAGWRKELPGSIMLLNHEYLPKSSIKSAHSIERAMG